MANTVIQLKWSNITDVPPSLNVAEPAYSNTSQKLFIGDSSGNVIAIGGKYYVDQQAAIYNTSNAAFVTANAAFVAANAANATDATQNNSITAAFSHANAAFVAANAANATDTTQNNSITAAFATANSAASYANSAFAAANVANATDTTQNNSITAAFATANSGASYANSAFIRANNSINANTGGTITGSLTISGGNLSVTGNLIVSGNTITQNVSSLNIADPLIYLAANNYTSDVVEIGFAANYYDGATQRHTGVFREASNKEFYVFDNYDKEPDANLIDINDASFRVATLNANVKSTTITVKGIDLLPYVNSAYTAANTADAKATSAGSYANSAFAAANAATAADTTQNNSITAAFATANSAASYGNSAFATANSAGSYANAAFAKANTDATNISISAGDFGSASAVASFRVEANGRISSANSTTIAIAASAITSGTLGVARGGTGAATFTTNGVLLGQGTSALTTASSSTEGHVLTINASGVPTFSHLQGGTF